MFIKMKIMGMIMVLIYSTVFLYGCSDNQETVYMSGTNDEKESYETEFSQAITDTTVKESRIFVQISGAVNKPGVYEFKERIRVFEAIEQTGGLNSEAYTDSINMAKPISDEMVIYVPTVEEASNSDLNTGDNQSFGTKEESGKENKSSVININTASAAELMTLPGVGQAKASAIIAYREEIGGFTDISQIKNISGIKDALFNKIKDYITV